MEPKFCLDGYSHQSACLTSAVPVRGLIDKVLLMPPDATECYSSHQLECRAVLTRNILDLLKFLLFSQCLEWKPEPYTQSHHLGFILRSVLLDLSPLEFSPQAPSTEMENNSPGCPTQGNVCFLREYRPKPPCGVRGADSCGLFSCLLSL